MDIPWTDKVSSGVLKIPVSTMKENSWRAFLPPYLHILQVPTPFPVGPVNLYLTEGDPLTLIDVGPRYGPAREVLEKALAALGFRLADLKRLVLTHAHSDHYGLAGTLAEISSPEILTHRFNFSLMADYEAERERWSAFYSALMKEAGMPVEEIQQVSRARRSISIYASPVHPTRTLEDGDTLRLGDEDWVVLHTPGHAGGLICLYQPERRLLISSDHLLRDISSNPIVEPPEREGGERPRRLVDYMGQLRRIADLPIALALPGHGPPIEDVPGLIERRLSFHEQRAKEILQVLRREPLTPYEISLELFPQLDPINRFLALSEVIGHLDMLEAEGKVSSLLEDGVRRWRRTD